MEFAVHAPGRGQRRRGKHNADHCDTQADEQDDQCGRGDFVGVGPIGPPAAERHNHRQNRSQESTEEHEQFASAPTDVAWIGVQGGDDPLTFGIDGKDGVAEIAVGKALPGQLPHG